MQNPVKRFFAIGDMLACAYIIGRNSIRLPCVRVCVHACVCVYVCGCVCACGGCWVLGGAVRRTHTIQVDPLRTQLTPLHPTPYTTIPPYPHPDGTIHRPLLCYLIFQKTS